MLGSTPATRSSSRIACVVTGGRVRRRSRRAVRLPDRVGRRDDAHRPRRGARDHVLRPAHRARRVARRRDRALCLPVPAGPRRDSLLDVAAVFVSPTGALIDRCSRSCCSSCSSPGSPAPSRKFATLGPTRRAPARIEPVTPADVHMPGGSAAPILAAFGAGALFLGLGPRRRRRCASASIVLVVTLLVWFREAHARLRPPRAGRSACRPSRIHDGPPPGVHMPGPSIRPLLGALGSAALLGGLVVGGWVLILAVVFLVYTLIGWLVDFTAEYRKVEEADRTGHLENIPDRARCRRGRSRSSPSCSCSSGCGSSASSRRPSRPTAGGPGASPGASGRRRRRRHPAAGPLVVVAKDVAFDKHELEVAGRRSRSRSTSRTRTRRARRTTSRSGRAGRHVAPGPGRRPPAASRQAYQYDPLPAGRRTSSSARSIPIVPR